MRGEKTTVTIEYGTEDLKQILAEQIEQKIIEILNKE